MGTGKVQDIAQEKGKGKLLLDSPPTATSGWLCWATSSLHRPSSQGGGGGVVSLAMLLSSHPPPWHGPEDPRAVTPPRRAGDPPKQRWAFSPGSCSDLGHAGQTHCSPPRLPATNEPNVQLASIYLLPCKLHPRSRELLSANEKKPQPTRSLRAADKAARPGPRTLLQPPSPRAGRQRAQGSHPSPA